MEIKTSYIIEKSIVYRELLYAPAGFERPQRDLDTMATWKTTTRFNDWQTINSPGALLAAERSAKKHAVARRIMFIRSKTIRHGTIIAPLPTNYILPRWFHLARSCCGREMTCNEWSSETCRKNVFSPKWPPRLKSSSDTTDFHLT